MIWCRSSYVARNTVEYNVVDEDIINKGADFSVILVGKVISA